MLNTLTWNNLRDPGIVEAVDELRQETLRLLFGISVLGYLAWHVGSLFTYSVLRSLPQHAPAHWTLFPVVSVGFVAVYLSQRRSLSLAIVAFLVSSLVSVTAAVWTLHSMTASLLYPLIALTAVVLMHPLAGLVVSVASPILLSALQFSGLTNFVGTDHVLVTATFCLLTVIAAWALGRNMMIAVEWSLHSYAQALQSVQDAQRQRAKLVQALKQLDNAYYHLERANAALELAWKAAEESERSKTEFVTNISHELRTPLNLIVGFSQMILTSPESYSEPLPADYRGDLNAIYRSAQHLLMLANDVIDLARVGVGRLALAREPVDLRQIIGDACNLVREYISAKGLWLRTEIQEGLPEAPLDPLRIRQVLLNLLTNAARFTDAGGITVSALVEDGAVVVRVTDTGRGISLDDLPKVFDEFYHTSGAQTGAQSDLDGFGLGLPITKRLVELHGGQMGVESTLGTGTTFWFILPLVSIDGTSSSGKGYPLRSARLMRERERICILVCQDEWIGPFLEQHLRDCRILTAIDLTSARSLAEEHRAAAIIADIGTRDDGHTGDSIVPLIRLTLPRRDRLADHLGVIDYLVKPVSRADLRAVIDRLGRPVENILVVDDDPRFARLITRLLQTSSHERPYRVVGVHNGRDALHLVERTRPDLVFLDLAIPEISGESVIAAMRANSNYADIPVVIISAQDHLERCFPLTGEMSVSKPDGWGVEELLATLEALLRALGPPRRHLRHDGPSQVNTDLLVT